MPLGEERTAPNARIMLLIQKGKPTKRACDRCHRVRVTFRRGPVCDNCREFDRKVAAYSNRFYQQALALQAEIAKRRVG